MAIGICIRWFTDDRNINWYSHCENQYGVFSKKKVAAYDPAEPLLGYTWRTLITNHRDRCLLPCLLLLYSQQAGYGTILEVYQQMPGLKTLWCIYTIGFYSALIEKWNCDIFRKTDGSGNNYVERHKPESERQTLNVFSHTLKLYWDSISPQSECAPSAFKFTCV